MDGATTTAFGHVDLSSQGGVHVGNCDTDGFVSQLTKLESGVWFVLKQLHNSPFCGGDSVSGELTGCVGFE